MNGKGALILSSNVDDNLLEEVMNAGYFVKLLDKVIKLIRKVVSLQQNIFDGTFSSNCQVNSVPKELLTLVNMLIEGTNINAKVTQPTFSTAQIIMFNFNPNKKLNSNASAPETKVTYHSKKRETP